ncbi:hypothetical protein ACFX1S_014876 [Malus domestica]
MEFIWPFSLLVNKGFLEAVEDHLVGCFSLPNALKISWRGHMLLNAILSEELRQVFAHKLWTVIGDDGQRDAKSANDVPPYEALYFHLSCGRHGLYFYSFGEVIGFHNHYVSAPSSRRHRSYQVDCPLHEWPRTHLRV